MDMTLELRGYQNRIINSVLGDWDRGYQKVLIMAATGTGKTIMFLETVNRILKKQPDARILIVAHRAELIQQPVERINRFWPNNIYLTGIVMGSKNQCAKKIIVATIQSLSKNRVEQILTSGAITHIIIDEAHHVVAPSYIELLKMIPDAKVLGCTATPKRTDKIGLGNVFDKVSDKIDIRHAVKNGILCPFEAIGIVLDDVDLDKLRETQDGWDDKKLGRLMSAQNIKEIVFQKWEEYASKRQTVAFCSSVQQAYEYAEFFRQQGVDAVAIDGKTKKKERQKILQDYADGTIQVLFNCYLLTEGWDAPHTSCVMNVRPTRSDLVYVQQMGRGLRPHNSKNDCLVIDFVPSTTRKIVTARNVLDGKSFEKKWHVYPFCFHLPEERVVEDEIDEEPIKIEGFSFKIKQDGTMEDIDPERLKEIALDYMNSSKLRWVFDDKIGTAQLDFGTGLVMILPEHNRIAQGELMKSEGRWNDGMERLSKHLSKCRLWIASKDKKNRWGAEFVGEFDFDAAKEKAEEIGYDYDLRKPSWHYKPISDGQARLLHRFGLYRPGMKRGEANGLLNDRFTKDVVLLEQRKLEREVYNG